MTNDIRTRADGSIDTGFYMERARHLRSRQAHAMVRSTPSETRRAPTLLQRIFG